MLHDLSHVTVYTLSRAGHHHISPQRIACEWPLLTTTSNCIVIRCLQQVTLMFMGTLGILATCFLLIHRTFYLYLFFWTVQSFNLHLRMLGTFNQHLPMILSDNSYSQRKPTSLLDTGMGGVPYFCAAEHEMCKVPRVNRCELQHVKSPWSSV